MLVIKDWPNSAYQAGYLTNVSVVTRCASRPGVAGFGAFDACGFEKAT